MKKKKFICGLLALSLSVGLLAGCGGQDGTGSGGGSNASAGNGDNTVTPEYVYVAEYIPVRGQTENGFNNGVYANGAIYTSSYEKVGEEPYEYTDPESGETVTEMSDQYSQVLWKLGLDGTLERVPYTAGKPEQQEGKTVYTNINGMCVGTDGTIYLLEETDYNWNEAPEGIEEFSDEYWNYQRYEQHYALITISPEGQQGVAIPLDALADAAEDGDYFYVSNMEVDDKGNLYLTGDQKVYILDAAGALQGTVDAGGWIERMVNLDGGIYCAYYGDAGEVLAQVDPETRSFGEEKQVQGDLYSMTAGGGDYDLYYTNGISFYGYDLDSGESERLLNWLSCDVDPDGGTTLVLDDGRVVRFLSEWKQDDDGGHTENQLVILTKQPYDSVPQKRVLTLATQYLSYDIRGQIIEFNRSHDDCRIEVQDYSEYNNYQSEDEADYTAGLTKLKTEIGAGQLPDILDLSGLPMEQLAAKGLLEDLYPYLDRDPELSREALIPNVLKAMEVDGKLYTTVGTFGIVTAIGAAKVVGDTPGWTYDEFNAALREMPEGCTAFDRYVTRDDMLRNCLALDGDSFVNWNTGECSFDSPAFVKMLEFVKSFPSEFDWENYEWTEEDDTPARIGSGRQMLVESAIYDFEDQQMYQAMFGGDATYIGLPTENGTGNMINPSGNAYAITSKCSDKDAAWQFLRQFFGENPDDDSWGLPINSAAFEKKLQEAMTPEYEKDANGNFILDENGRKVEVTRGSWSWGGLEIEMRAMNQAEADKLLDAVYSTTKLYKFDENIYDIVKEQTEAFFAGQKSAEDVAKLVQSKAMIYVNEQR